MEQKRLAILRSYAAAKHVCLIYLSLNEIKKFRDQAHMRRK